MVVAEFFLFARIYLGRFFSKESSYNFFFKHIFLINEKTITMSALLLAILLFTLLVLPICLKVNALLDSKLKRVYFTISIYAFTVSSGFVDYKLLKVCLRTPLKTKEIDFLALLKKQKKKGGRAKLSIYSIKSSVIVGINNESLIEYLCIYKVVSNFIAILKLKVNCINIKNDFALINGSDFIVACEISFLKSVVDIAAGGLKKGIYKFSHGKSK